MNKAVTGAFLLLLSLALFGCTGTKPPEGPTKADNGKVEAPQQQPDSGTVVYRNDEFGFSFALPASWKGYQIVTSQWEGFAPHSSGSGTPAATGPMLSFRHPQWTAQNPRQEIPIMVFTTGEWTALQAGEFHIGAGPVNPTELGRTAKHVFALPARYNYAFPEGYEEVERILANRPLQVMESQGR
jgi:hypothetical protein